MNDLIAQTKEYLAIQDELQGIRKENVLLLEDVLYSGSLTVNLERATKKGFIDAKSVYLN